MADDMHSIIMVIKRSSRYLVHCSDGDRRRSKSAIDEPSKQNDNWFTTRCTA